MTSSDVLRVVLGVVVVAALGGFVLTAAMPWPNNNAAGAERSLFPNKAPLAKQPQFAKPAAAGGAAHAQKKADLVPVDLHVMSICPDAVFCENFFSDVLEQVGEIVDLKTQYIVSAVVGDRFVCKHGANECEGNKVQLCARQVYSDPDQWFNFILCQDETYQSIPSNLESCATRLQLNSTDITRCVSVQGTDLLRTSAALTTSRAITKSCTVVINSQKVCIRDGGTWYDCPNGSTVADFVRQICDAYTGDTKPAACK